MNGNPSLQQLLGHLPHSTQDILNTARLMVQRGDLPGAHYLLEQAYQRHQDLRFLGAIASSHMMRGDYTMAFEMLEAHLDERAPDPNLVILMTEALIGKHDFAFAEQYIDYAEQLGGAQPRIENLRALLKQRVRERHSGAQTPKDMALDSRIDLTRPELTSLPLSETATYSTSPDQDPTEFISFSMEDAPKTTSMESVPTHIAGLAEHDLPTMAASAPPELFARDYPPIEDHTVEESISIPSVAQMLDRTTPVNSPSFRPHPHDVVDATIPFQRSLHIAPPPMEDVHDSTIQDAFVDDSMDRQVTSYVSLQSNSGAGFHSPEVFMPMEDEESPSQVRAAFFGTSSDLSTLDPPSPSPHDQPHFSPMSSGHFPGMADPAPSFGARPATSPSGLSSISERSSPLSPRSQPRFELHAGDRLPQNASSSIELDIIAPPSPPSFVQPNAFQPVSSGNPNDALPVYEKSRRPLQFPLLKLAIGIPIVLLLVALIGSVVTDQMLSSSLGKAKLDALQGAHDGTYSGARSTLDALLTSERTTHPLGQWAEDLSATFGQVLPIYVAPAARSSISAHTAYQAAWIEWRYEAPGSRDAARQIATARALLGEQHELIRRASIYEALTAHPDRALELAQLANQEFQADIDYAIPLALAAHRAGRPELSRQTLARIDKLVATQTDQRHLVLMLENMHRIPEFARKLDTTLKESEDAELELHMLRAQQHHTDLEAMARSATHLNTALSKPDASWHPCFTARIHHALSRVALAEQDFDRTLKSLEQAQELCPDLPFVQAALARHFIHTGEHVRAESLIARALERHPEAHLSLVAATLAMHRGDIEGHTDVLATLVEAKHPIALTQNAKRKLLLGDYEGALAQFEVAHEQDAQGGLPMAYTHLIRAITLPAKSQEQDEALEKLIKAQPYVSPELQRTLARIKLERAQHTSEKSARDALFASAQRAVTDFIALSQYEGIARYELCELYLAQRRYDSAREACDDAAKIDTQSIQGKLARARLELESGNAAKSKDLLLPLDTSRQDFLPLAEQLVRTYISQGDFGVAEQRLKKLATTYPDALVSKLLQGRLAFATSRYVEATETLQEVSDHASHPVEAQVFLAYARIRTGMLQAVEDPLKKHLSHPLWGGYAWLALGELRRRQKNFKHAEENLEKAHELLDHPYISSWFKIETLTQRALNWQAEHGWQHPNVASYLNQAARIDTESHADLNYLLGALELSQRKPDKKAAIARLERAITIDPRHCASLRTLDDLGQKKSGPFQVRQQLDLYCPGS